jgi:outer membrane protein TolC
MHRHLTLKRLAAFIALCLLLLPDAALLRAQDQGPVAPKPGEYRPYKTIVETAREQGTARDMHLDECIELALKNNLNIEYNRYFPLLRQESFLAANGVYDFVLDSRLAYQKNENPVTDQVRRDLLGIDTYKNTNYNFNVGVSRYLPTGGTVTLSFDNSRTANNTNVTNPTFDGSMNVSFTQPLWQNMPIDSSRRSIILASKDRTMSDIDFENQVSDTLRNVEVAYWDLVNAIETQRISIQSRELAIIQYRDNQKRVDIGTLAPITVTQTRAEVARQEQAVIAAEAGIIQSENILKSAIVKDPNDPVWNQVIIPVDEPQIPDKMLTTQEALDLAYKNRPEIRSLVIQLEKDDVDIKYFANQTKPRLDFVATYTSPGVAGPNVQAPVLDENGNPILDPSGNPLMQDTDFTGRLGTVYEQVFKQDFPNYSFALNLQYPLGNQTAKANLASARLAKEQNLTQQRQTLQNIRLEVINFVQTVEVNQRSLNTAIVARQFQEEQLNGETKRFQAGLSTNYEVLQTQRDLAQARASELAAKIDLKKAIVALQKATFTNMSDHQLQVALGR